jgi:replicative DNA helicase
MFLYREKGAQDESSSVEDIYLKVGKNRNGPTGRVTLLFSKNYARFESSTGKS